MKKANVLVGVPLFFVIGCASTNKLKLPVNSGGKKAIYSLSVPFKFKQNKVKYQNAEGNETLNEALISDGSVIYITDDKNAGGGKEDYKVEKYGEHYHFNYLTLADTATLFGVHNGKHWKEIKRGSVFVGYYHVDDKKKKQYDDIINSFIP